jgi:nitrate reductase (NAD(P)H)
MDPNKGIMLAHKMNGEDLRPDHGRPLRVVVPGQIGGRSVKWLTKLILTEKPSDNWYHIYDNRVLPYVSLRVSIRTDVPDSFQNDGNP